MLPVINLSLSSVPDSSSSIYDAGTRHYDDDSGVPRNLMLDWLKPEKSLLEQKIDAESIANGLKNDNEDTLVNRRYQEDYCHNYNQDEE